MIKRIRFATRRPDVPLDTFASVWRAAAAGPGAAPPDVAPVRRVVATALPEALAAPRHDGVGIEWFSDVGHLQRYEAWLQAAEADARPEGLRAVIDVEDSPVVVARELVLRGSDWLEDRWRQGGDRVKHMALARRAAGLTPEEFQERWQNRAGQLRSPTTGEVVVIPDRARGHAYVQNHPLPPGPDGVDWAYDAVNEVYFDDVEALQQRIEWLAENLGSGTEDDLVSQSWFLSVREEVVLGVTS